MEKNGWVIRSEGEKIIIAKRRKITKRIILYESWEGEKERERRGVKEKKKNRIR